VVRDLQVKLGFASVCRVGLCRPVVRRSLAIRSARLPMRRLVAQAFAPPTPCECQDHGCATVRWGSRAVVSERMDPERLPNLRPFVPFSVELDRRRIEAGIDIACAHGELKLVFRSSRRFVLWRPTARSSGLERPTGVPPPSTGCLFDASPWPAYRRIERLTRGGVVQTDTEGSSEGRAPPQLEELDAGGTATLNLYRPWRSGGRSWLLAQAGRPVGMIERAAGGTSLRTPTEEWRAEVRRRPRRLGWHLEFTRADGGDPVLHYRPRGVLPGGRLVVTDKRRYRLRSPLLRADWRLTAVPGGEIARIGFRQREPIRYLTMQLAFGENAADEPMLPVVIMAASLAILIHDEEPKTVGGPWP
jgi:hypothetical protein